ncbi:MAG: type I pantothenate kinase, partial [Microbacterium sp.]
APNVVAVSDLFDFSIYVDAESAHIERWFVNRFLKLRAGAFANPASYFNVFAGLSDAEAEQTALGFWRDINMPNLIENVLPTKHRATLVLQKGASHAVESVLLRKV